MGHHDLCLVSCILSLYPVLHNPPLVFLLFIGSHLQNDLVPLNPVDVAQCLVLSSLVVLSSTRRVLVGVELLRWWGLLLFDSLLFADPQSPSLSSTTISTFKSPREGINNLTTRTGASASNKFSPSPPQRHPLDLSRRRRG